MPIFPRIFSRIPFIPRVSLLSRPLLPLTRLSGGHSSPALQVRSSRFGWIPTHRLFHTSYSRLSTSSPPPSPSESASGAPPNASFSQKLKHLIKTYGWYALGVYITISVVDFGVAFGAVNVIGAEQVSSVTHAVKDYVVSYIHSAPAEPGKEELEVSAPGGREGLYAMLILAYTVHKTLFLPFRVGLTAAITPKLVGWLRTRGWAGGQGTMRAAREMRERMRRREDRD